MNVVYNLCSFHVKLESIVTPKNVVIFSIRGKPLIIKLESILCELFVLKWMKFVLLILRDNLLHLNHVDILDNSEFRRLVRMSRFLCERNTLVSSVKIMKFKTGDELIMSFM